jgi:hypothetical protein
MIGNRLLTAMLLCGAFMEDERPRPKLPPKREPPPEPDTWRDSEHGIEIGEHLPTQITHALRESHDVLPDPPAVWRQGNTLGKTSVDMRELLDGITSERQIGSTADGMRAFGMEASRASEAVRRFSERMADDIPARATEPYRPAHAPPRKVAYVPFYTPEEQAERAARAKAKKAKRKSAQAAKRRNRS